MDPPTPAMYSIWLDGITKACLLVTGTLGVSSRAFCNASGIVTATLTIEAGPATTLDALQRQLRTARARPTCQNRRASLPWSVKADPAAATVAIVACTIKHAVNFLC